MVYRIVINEKIKRKITKYGSGIEDILNKILRKLVEDPYPRDKRHFLKRTKDGWLCELSPTKSHPLRIYYIIIEEKIILRDIEYSGTVSVKDISRSKDSNKKGTSKQQKKN